MEEHYCGKQVVHIHSVTAGAPHRVFPCIAAQYKYCKKQWVNQSWNRGCRHEQRTDNRHIECCSSGKVVAAEATDSGAFQELLLSILNRRLPQFIVSLPPILVEHLNDENPVLLVTCA